MEEFDTIVIGSGAGGLAAALCLARSGQKVLVLEQHTVPGGWCHSFTLNGQRFSPGVHYIGLLDEGQSTNVLYKGLGVADDLIFFRMNPKGYDHCFIGERQFDLPAGVNNLEASLIKHFPHESKNIKEYLSLISKVNTELQLIPKLKGFWQKITVPFRTKHFGKFALFSLKRVIGWHIKDPVLRAVLNSQCGDHGLPPARASFPVHCSVMYHYFEGGYYPMGGGGGIVKAMTSKIKEYGGVVRTASGVEKILVKDNRAYGVRLDDQSEIFAGNIISNADPSTTFTKLIDPEHISKKFQKKLDNTKYSITSLILFLTLEMDVTAAGIDSGNIWKFKNEDLDGLFNILLEGDLSREEKFPALFLSCTTLKDPASFNGKYHNFEIVTYIGYDALKNFNNIDDYHTGEYHHFKERIIEMFMNTVEELIPGAKKHVVQAELGTPKTNQYYVRSTRGSVYGTEKTLRQVGPFAYKHKSPIDGLYLCGASTTSHGVTGASYSGVEAAAVILGTTSADLLKDGQDKKLRIYDAENPDTWDEYIHKKRSDKVRTFKEISINTPAAG